MLLKICFHVRVVLTQRTNLTSLQPSRDAMEVESVVAHTPSHGALLSHIGHLVSLALDAYIHG